PYAALVRCIWTGEEEEAVIRAAQSGGAALAAARPSGALDVVGPCPAPLSKLNGRYRWHLLLKGEPGTVREAALSLRAAAPPGDDVRLSVDVDPASML